MSYDQWTTADEIHYLNKQGQHSAPWTHEGLTRVQLLRAYITNAPKRFNWGSIDPEVAVAHATRLLELEHAAV